MFGLLASFLWTHKRGHVAPSHIGLNYVPMVSISGWGLGYCPLFGFDILTGKVRLIDGMWLIVLPQTWPLMWEKQAKRSSGARTWLWFS